MLILGHIGIGAWLIRLSSNAPLNLLFFGCLLPDLIDKPIYYLNKYIPIDAKYFTISSTRSIGHSLLLCLIIAMLLYFYKKKYFAPIILGILSHLLLDNIYEYFTEPFSDYSSRIALFYPYFDWKFPLAKFNDIHGQLLSHLTIYDISGEIIGLILLISLVRKSKKINA